MTGAALEIHFDDAEVQAAMNRLAEFGDGGSRMVAVWDAIGGKMESATQLRFPAQHAPDGSPWKASQRALREGGQTLIWHGFLMASITYNVTADGVEWGSGLDYAAAMQGGADIDVHPRSQQIYRRAGKDGIAPGFVTKSRSNFATWATIGAHTIHIEARAFLGINEDDRVEIGDTLAHYLQAAIAGDGAAAP